MTTTPITPEERATLQQFCNMILRRGCPAPGRDIREFPALVLKVLHALAAAEARAEKAETANAKCIETAEHMRELAAQEAQRRRKAERERDVLAREVMRRGDQSDYDLCPYDGVYKCLHPNSLPCRRSIDGVKLCWLEWAAQQAAERGEGKYAGRSPHDVAGWNPNEEGHG